MGRGGSGREAAPNSEATKKEYEIRNFGTRSQSGWNRNLHETNGLRIGRENAQHTICV